MVGLLGLWLGAASGAADVDMRIDAGATPTPVADWVRRDVLADRRGRAGTALVLASPAAVILGGTLLRSFNGLPDQPRDRFGVGFTAQALGVVGLLVGPVLLVHGGWRSSVALRRQGLPAPSQFVVASAASYVLSGVLFVTSQARPTNLVAAVAAYGAGLGLGVVQLRQNHLVRRRAGWVGVAPFIGGRTPGLAVVGTF